jgi:hypothetical protein
MSFDLYFCWHQKKLINFDSVAEWSQKHCYFQRNDNQLWYNNQDTGVYFSIYFEIKDPEEQVIPSGYVDSGLSFNLNFSRPSFFAREAMPVVVDLCRHFGLAAYDPQQSEKGVVNEDPTVAALINSWLRSNRNAVKALHEAGAAAPLRMAASIAEYLWSYSRRKQELQAKVGDDIFVPGLFPFRKAGSSNIGTMIVCTAGIPMILPDSHWVLIRYPRKRLLGMKEDMKTGVVCRSTFETSVEDLMDQYSDWEPPVRIINPKSAEAMAERLRSIQDTLPPEEFERVALDDFIDFENGH